MTQQNNPLHGVTLQAILTELVEHYGWEELSYMVNINCFKSDPTIKSSLKFLRKHGILSCLSVPILVINRSLLIFEPKLAIH